MLMSFTGLLSRMSELLLGVYRLFAVAVSSYAIGGTISAPLRCIVYVYKATDKI
jgi:hypothetical protein